MHDTVKSEIMWSINVVMSNYSYHSCEGNIISLILHSLTLILLPTWAKGNVPNWYYMG